MNAAARALLLILPLAACGGGENAPADAQQTDACFANEASGTYQTDRK